MLYVSFFYSNSKSIFSGGHRTPNRRGRGISESANLGARDNNCFGSGMEDFDRLEEFDFEKNLALFDKVFFF